MSQSRFRRIVNRPLLLLARFLPGNSTVRPLLHRMRGVRILGRVVIGDDVYLENEHPEAVEIHDGVHIALRATIIAHAKGGGKVILEKDSFIGPASLILCASGKTLRIGEGAVVSAGSVVKNSVPPRALLAGPQATVVARVTVPWPVAGSYEEFVRGLRPTG